MHPIQIGRVDTGRLPRANWKCSPGSAAEKQMRISQPFLEFGQRLSANISSTFIQNLASRIAPPPQAFHQSATREVMIASSLPIMRRALTVK